MSSSSSNFSILIVCWCLREFIDWIVWLFCLLSCSFDFSIEGPSTMNCGSSLLALSFTTL